MLEVSPVRAFSDNYIWLIRTLGDPAGAAVVEPGDARPVEDVLDREGLRLRASFVTHHPDHVGGVREPASRPGGPALAQAREARFEASRELRSRDEPTLASTIGLERRIKPFLRCREPAVRAGATAQAGRRVSSVEEVFAVSRSWKDGFR
jgi:glyoxylase-like metal-dependent hydrolase (beta-lactamase superfamily II)